MGRFGIPALLLVAVLLGVPVGDCVAEASDDAPSAATVLVELFTSQGCSSCPPADRFLTELAERADLDIIPLSFHVDYWNYIGWTDPFSSAEWSARQRRYASSLGSRSVYTPQIVVNGIWEGVGSNRREIMELLERARSESSRAELHLRAKYVSEDRLHVVVEVGRIDPQLRSTHLEIWLAVVESGLVTPVGRGENASKTLRNDRVVRRLERVSSMESGRSGATGSLELGVEGDWRRDQLRVIAFLQEAESLRVRAAVESEIIH